MSDTVKELGLENIGMHSLRKTFGYHQIKLGMNITLLMRYSIILKEQNYKVKDFEIENIRYEDGHTFFLEILLNVEKDVEIFEWSETVDVWAGKAWIIEKDDPFAMYRDGKMNFDIGEELQEDEN